MKKSIDLWVTKIDYPAPDGSTILSFTKKPERIDTLPYDCDWTAEARKCYFIDPDLIESLLSYRKCEFDLLKNPLKITVTVDYEDQQVKE